MNFFSLIESPGTNTDIRRIQGERPQSKGQWTHIKIIGTETGGTNGASIDSITSVRNSISSVERNEISLNRNFLSASSQIVSSIALPMPDSLPFSYQSDWSEDSLGIIEKSTSNVSEFIKGNKSIQDVFEQLKVDSKNSLANIMKSTGFKKTLKNAGLAFNPSKELFYNSPQIRAFNLSWEFSFQSKKQVETFKAMIRELLIHMHPEFADGNPGGTYSLPETFSIDFVNAETRKINHCVLTQLNIEYAGSGAGWKAFFDGNPSHVNLQLGFQELTPLTKEDIRRGF